MRRAALAIVALLTVAGGCSSRDDVANFDAANAEMTIEPSPIDDALEWRNAFECPKEGCEPEQDGHKRPVSTPQSWRPARAGTPIDRLLGIICSAPSEGAAGWLRLQLQSAVL
jgi:hypothetical protein